MWEQEKISIGRIRKRDYICEVEFDEDTPHKKGISGGKILRLLIVRGDSKGNTVVAKFSEGEWNIEPLNKEVSGLVIALTKRYNR